VGCRADADCAAGEICRADQVCVPNPWACTTDADCDARGGYVCTNGECGTASSHGCNSQNCPCDVLAQNCAFGMRCYPFGPLTTDGQCFVPGTRAAGDACVEPPFGEPESCGNGRSGAAEVRPGPAIKYRAPTTWLHASSTGTRADWGLCAAPPPPPPPTCDALAQDCSTSGDLCAPVDIGANVCVPAGRGAEGSACTRASDCSGGLACVAEAGATPTTQYWTLFQAYIDRGGGTCKALCLPGRACAGGQSCEPIIDSNTGNTRTDVGACH
jgi:Cys-rich repeat protein